MNRKAVVIKIACSFQVIFKVNIISVGDCAYGDSSCISQANINPDQVHVSRAKNNRVFYNALPEKSENRGRPKRYGRNFG